MRLADRRLLHWSLVAVWLATAGASLWEWHGQSLALLAPAGIAAGHMADALIVGGATLDLALGLALALRPGRVIYLAALAAMTVMTAIAAVVDPSLWLHPLGPLTKNLPIAAILWVLARPAPVVP